MSKQFDNELKGALFKNKDKESDTHPDYNGSCEIDGVGYFMDAWINEAKDGSKYMSVRFKAKNKQRGNTKPAAKTVNRGDGRYDRDDSEPPF
jgi:hypothetical protein